VTRPACGANPLLNYFAVLYLQLIQGLVVPGVSQVLAQSSNWRQVNLDVCETGATGINIPRAGSQLLGQRVLRAGTAHVG